MRRGEWFVWRMPVLLIALLMAAALMVPAAADECTVVGTSGDDYWAGNSDAISDVYCGGSGNDWVFELGPGDVFYGQNGTDHATLNFGTFDGGRGIDYVVWNYGTFHGDRGDDWVANNYGAFFGGNGYDYLFLNEGVFDPGRQ